jgi:hypothetical protein
MPALVSSVSSADGTSSAINTTGSNLIVLVQNTLSPGAVSDSNSNTWTKVTSLNGNRATCSIYYCSSPTVGSGHTFSSIGNFGSFQVFAFSGAVSSSPLDVFTTGSFGSGVTAETLGPLTTTGTNGDIVVAGWVLDDPSVSSVTVSSGWTDLFFPEVAGSAFGGVGAYIFQGTAGSISCTMTRNSTTSLGDAGVIVGFKAAAGGGTNNNLSVSGGTYSLTGSSTTLSTNLPVTGGSYSLTGTATTLKTGLPVSGSSYSLTGTATVLNTSLPLAGGSYGLTGTATTLTHNTSGAFSLSLGSGSYGLSGSSVSLTHTTTQVTTGGRQVWPEEVDDLTLATHKWHQRLVEANSFKTGEEIHKIAQSLGKLGGQARAKALTQTQRTNIATKAAQARWR